MDRKRIHDQTHSPYATQAQIERAQRMTAIRESYAAHIPETSWPPIRPGVDHPPFAPVAMDINTDIASAIVSRDPGMLAPLLVAHSLGDVTLDISDMRWFDISASAVSANNGIASDVLDVCTSHGCMATMETICAGVVSRGEIPAAVLARIAMRREPDAVYSGLYAISKQQGYGARITGDTADMRNALASLNDAIVHGKMTSDNALDDRALTIDLHPLITDVIRRAPMDTANLSTAAWPNPWRRVLQHRFGATIDALEDIQGIDAEWLCDHTRIDRHALASAVATTVGDRSSWDALRIAISSWPTEACLSVIASRQMRPCDPIIAGCICAMSDRGRAQDIIHDAERWIETSASDQKRSQWHQNTHMAAIEDDVMGVLLHALDASRCGNLEWWRRAPSSVISGMPKIPLQSDAIVDGYAERMVTQPFENTGIDNKPCIAACAQTAQRRLLAMIIDDLTDALDPDDRALRRLRMDGLMRLARSSHMLPWLIQGPLPRIAMGFALADSATMNPIAMDSAKTILAACAEPSVTTA